MSLTQRVFHLPGVLDVPVGDGDDAHLLRREPHRERPRVVLHQDAEEAFQRTEQRPVHHVGAMFHAVLAHVGHVEALRLVEVKLDRRQLPLAA